MAKKIVGFRVGAGVTSVVQNGASYNTEQSYNPLLLSASMFQLNWDNKRPYNNTTPFIMKLPVGTVVPVFISMII